MRAVQRRADLELQVVCYASALLDEYGRTWERVTADGFAVAARLRTQHAGADTDAMAKTSCISGYEAINVVRWLDPDVVLLVGDRHEVWGVAGAVAQLNVPIAHTMGGEVSGTIDEKLRHSITKLADLHFVASEDAEARVLQLGEHPDRVHRTGCPRIDAVREATRLGPAPEASIMVSLHPVTTRGDDGAAMGAILDAIETVAPSFPVHVFWPNSDAGGADIEARIRSSGYTTHARMAPEDYWRMMASAAVLVGNSSSGIREGAYLGTPVVNVGSRQEGRARAANVLDVDVDAGAIAAAIRTQIERGGYEPDALYGDGHAGPRIAEVLAVAELGTEKRFRCV